MLLRLTHVDMLESNLLLSNCCIMPHFDFIHIKGDLEEGVCLDFRGTSLLILGRIDWNQRVCN